MLLQFPESFFGISVRTKLSFRVLCPWKIEKPVFVQIEIVFLIKALDTSVFLVWPAVTRPTSLGDRLSFIALELKTKIWICQLCTVTNQWVYQVWDHGIQKSGKLFELLSLISDPTESDHQSPVMSGCLSLLRSVVENTRSFLFRSSIDTPDWVFGSPIDSFPFESFDADSCRTSL